MGRLWTLYKALEKVVNSDYALARRIVGKRGFKLMVGSQNAREGKVGRRFSADSIM
jgi:hypothetical protein